ncbi:MAG: phosphoribosylformylglycinamidine synthase subunit PurS [Chloroflexi bacterium]|nr:phosphoribosylformylglycinamidine synthase subunit PurS [Chloroflexota bacterium]
MFLAKVYVVLKPTVNDPQGLTIKGGLHTLGFGSVKQVRAGKYMEIQIDEADVAIAREKVKAMCQKLLANPVIETYRFDLEALPAPAPAGSGR